MVLQSRRKTTRSLVALSSLSLASLASAIVVPGSSSSSQSRDQWGESSVRKSINFGPSLSPKHYSSVNPSPALELFNSQSSLFASATRDACATAADDPATCLGRGIATDFLSVLYPASSFRLVDGYLSSHSGVFHAHFVQLVNGVPVANGNLNVNVDLAEARVVSYGDSSFSHAASIGHQIEAWKSKVASWAEGATQVILGGAATDDAPVERFESPPLVAAGSVHDAQTSLYEKDPRHGLLSFLAFQSPSPSFTSFLLNTPRQDLLNLLLAVKPVESEDTSFEIHNVPTALAPVKASLAYVIPSCDAAIPSNLTRPPLSPPRSYVHDGEETIRLTWKYEILTTDNQYEAYVDATPGANEEPLLVVDWVRDFRPTGGELGLEALTLHQSVVNSHKQRSRGGRKPVFLELKHSALESRSDAVVEDADTIAELKKAKPEYRVFPWGVCVVSLSFWAH